jgi:hypothetical protein
MLATPSTEVHIERAYAEATHEFMRRSGEVGTTFKTTSGLATHVALQYGLGLIQLGRLVNEAVERYGYDRTNGSL